jgi:serine/threonine protein kinase/Tol biopolymer transport system component
MALAVGTKLDVYEVLGLLGAGGMGEVYRARDPALKREVAIKVLPPYVSRDPDRLHRFEQEAQAAAALNHPNILGVYQFGVFEGAPYLVSELLEGGTLRQVLQRAPLPIRKTIDYAVQIAHGLAAAHELGIVHRDLKPENLFVTKDGRIKILDFGLAKLMQSQPDPDGNVPTLTDPGMVMGTAGYMSPEQVRGKAVDHRTDIFAFGAILYEMLMGTRAFHRSTSAETMTAILNDEPTSISQLVQTIPPGLQRVVHRCLEKNPEQRFHSASDLAFALEALSESGSAAPISVPAEGKRSRSKVLMWSIGPVAVLALGAAAYYFGIRQEKVPFEHYSIQKGMDSESVELTAISPDGNYLAAVVRDANGARSLMLHHIPTNSERPIVQDAAYEYRDVIFSPDGSYIYFRIDALGAPPPDRTDVYRIPVLGGQVTQVIAGVDSPLSFIDGGHRVCFNRQDRPAGTYKFLTVAVGGGDEQILASGKKPFADSAVCAANGRFAVFAEGSGAVESLDFASGSKRSLTSLTTLGGDLYDLLWTPSGEGLFANISTEARPNGQIGFLSYPGGKLRQITNDLSGYQGLSLTSDARTLATRQYDRNSRFAELSLADPSHVSEHQIGRLYWFTWVDNDKIVTSDVGSGLRVVDLNKNQTTTLNVAKEHTHSAPALCGPDALVVSSSADAGIVSVYKMNLDGSGPTQLTKGPVDLFPECTADGKWLFYSDNRESNMPLLMRQPLAGGAAQMTIKDRLWFNLSSDGKLLAHMNLEGAPRLHINSTDSLQEIRSFPLPRDCDADDIAFSADDKSVFYTVRAGEDTTIWRQLLDAAPPVKVASLTGKYVYWLRPSPDGKKLGLTIGRPTSEAVLLHDLR